MVSVGELAGFEGSPGEAGGIAASPKSSTLTTPCGVDLQRIAPLLVGRDLRLPFRVGLGDPRAAEAGRDEAIWDQRQEPSDDSAAHGVAVEMGLLDLEMIHQLDHVFRPAGAVELRLVALAVIPAIKGHDHVVLGQGVGDAVGEPVALVLPV